MLRKHYNIKNNHTIGPLSQLTIKLLVLLLITKNNMTNKNIKLGTIFGAGIGLLAGILTGNIAIGLALGAGVGLVFGTVIKK